MLLEFSCTNFRSIYSEVSYSMIASDNNIHIEDLINVGDKKVLRAGAIFGPNGTGKTTLLLAIRTLYWMVIHSKPRNFELPYEPYLLHKNEATVFSIWFEKNGIIYFYQVSFNESMILTEKLYCSNGSLEKLFERENQGKGFELISEVQINELLLPYLYNENPDEHYKNVWQFFSEDIICFDYYSDKTWSNANAIDFFSNKLLKNEFLKIISVINPKIKDVIIDISKKKLDYEIGADSEILERAIKYDSNIQIQYDGFSVPLREESMGIQKLFAYLCPIIKSIKLGKVFICDELERSFHPLLVKKIFELFQKNKQTWAQIICTTHSTEILDLSILSKDQIWFTELDDEEEGTILYSLSDVKDVSDNEDIRLGYLDGCYGGIPKNIFNSLLGDKDD